MTVPPPHYSRNPYLPPELQYRPPGPPRMPGLTTTAVVLLWVMVAFSTLGALFTIPMVFAGSDFLDLFGPDAALLLTISAAQGLVWAGLRAYLAVKIWRRSRAARSAAFIVESAGLACQLVFAVLLFNSFTSAMETPREGMSYSFSFDCTGLVLPILVMCFLATARSRWWCDR